MQYAGLTDVAINAPGRAPAKAALAVLRDLAGAGDLDALLSLGQVVAHELGCGSPTTGLRESESLADLMDAADVPPLVRVYAIGHAPRELLGDFSRPAQLATEALVADDFERFQTLIRRNAPVQHEVLRAYVLCGFVQAYGEGPLADLVAGATKLAVLDLILRNAKVVAGTAADASLEFGRDFILTRGSVHSLMTAIWHELAHHTTEAAMSGAQPSTLASAPAQALPELGAALPGVLDAARTAQAQPPQPKDPRRWQAAAGLSVMCTVEHPPGGVYTHFSITDAGGPIAPSLAHPFAYYILRLVDADPLQVAAAHSSRGMFHLGVPGPAPDPQAVRERSELTGPPDFEEAAAAADDWFAALRTAGRVGGSESDVRFILGVEQRLPTVYGAPGSAQAWHDTEVCAGIRAGADLKAATGASPRELIRLAVRCGDPIVLERVLAAGGSVLGRQRPGEIGLEDLGGTCCVVRDGAEGAYFGPRTTDLLAVISLLREAGFDLDAADGDGETLLTDAAARSDALVAFLISMSASVDQPNGRGETPLVVAAKFGQTTIAQRLLSRGAAVDAGDVDGATALHHAAAGDDPGLLMLLLDHGAEPNAGSKLGETPLMAASSPAVASTLCAAGADPNATSNSGQTPLMHAANRGLDDVVRALLDAGADADAVTDLGETALHFAAIAPSGPDTAAARVLLDAGADVDEETNDGVTPLMLAARWAKPDLTRFLVARGADVNRKAPNGITALMFASDGRHEGDRDPTVVDRMQTCIRLLVEAGADVNATNAHGETALHWATTGFHAGPVAELLDLGADPNLPTAEGVTPLAYVRDHERPHEQMIEDLVAAGARDDVRDL